MHTQPVATHPIYTITPSLLPHTTSDAFLTEEERSLVMLDKELGRLRRLLQTALASSELPRHCGRIDVDIDHMLDHQRTVLDPFTLKNGRTTDWLKEVIQPMRPSAAMILAAADRDSPDVDRARRALSEAYEAIFQACEVRAREKLAST